MKYFNFIILVLFFSFCFSAASSQLADASKLQPIPPGVHPSNPGNINNNGQSYQNNSLLQEEISQYEFNPSQLDQDTGSTYVDTADHLLFVVDTQDNSVLVYDLTPDNVLIDDTPDYILGQPDFTSSAPATTQSGLNGPQGIAYDPETQELFVADTGNNRIMVFDVSSITNGEDAINVLGQPDFTSSAPGTTQSGLDGPSGLDYDPVNHLLLVTDSGNNRVVTFDVSSTTNNENAANVLGQPNFISSIPGAGQSTLDKPSGVAYDSKTSSVFVEDTGNNRVMVFSASQLSNGEKASDVISPSGYFAINPLIITRLQSNPKTNVGSKVVPKRNKKTASGLSLFWWIIFFIIVIVAAVVIWYNR